jgi:hypothetical protein
MSRFSSSLRKVGIGALAALTVAGTVAASTAGAEARPFHHGGWHHRGGGWVGPAIVGGVAAGLLAAPYYGGYYGRRCWTERQEVVDAYGRVFLRPVRVCG